MPNHVHLLVREQVEGLVAPIKSIAISYAQYFNYKYEHSGQLFQDRFKSEPVNDMAYFVHSRVGSAVYFYHYHLGLKIEEGKPE